MGALKKYGFRLGVGILVYAFLHISYADDLASFTSFSMLDKVMVVYTSLVVVIIWEGFDVIFRYLERKNTNYTYSPDLFKAVLLLSVFMVPAVFAASAFSEFYIKPTLVCRDDEHMLYKELMQGSIMGWLIIAARIIRISTIQNKQLEQDKALVQKELLQSKYHNLKNQINPHFLFNSFSVLQSLIEVDPKRATIFLTKLSSMYRYLLEKREEAMSSLEREVEMLHVYMYLLKTRHEDSLQLVIDIDESFYQFFVPTLSLQMLVENAVKHNRFSKNEPLLINIFIQDEYLVVRNSVKRKGSEPVSTKVGLENIRNQYQLQSDKSVVVIESEQSFTVKLPVLSRLKLA